MVPKPSPPARHIASYNSFLRFKDQKSRIQAKYISSIESQQFVLRKVAAVYSGSAGQAAVLKNLYDTEDGRILAEDSLERIAHRICATWEPQQLSPPRLISFVKFLKFILTHTNSPGKSYSLDSALYICNYRHSAFPTVHAPLVLALALGYLERLSERYGSAKGEPGCAQRLFLIAYMIAAKYLHANLASCGQLSPLLQRSSSGSSAFRIHPSQYSRPSSPSYPGSPPESPMAEMISAIPRGSFMIMTSSTNFLARILPNVTTRELYRMEIEFLSFLDYDVAVHGVEEVENWKSLYFTKCDTDKVVIKCEQEDINIKLEQVDEGIGHYEPEDGGHAEDAMARGNMLM